MHQLSILFLLVFFRLETSHCEDFSFLLSLSHDLKTRERRREEKRRKPNVKSYLPCSAVSDPSE